MAKSEDKYEETAEFIKTNFNNIIKEGQDCSYKYKQKKQRNKKARAEYGELEENLVGKLIDICKWNTAKNLMDLASKIMVCLEYEIYRVKENRIKQRIENIKKKNSITNADKKEKNNSESSNDEDDNINNTDTNVNNTERITNNTNPSLNEKEEKHEKQFTFLSNDPKLIENVNILLECKLMQVKSILNKVQTEKQENKSSKIDNSNNPDDFENITQCQRNSLIKYDQKPSTIIDSQNEQRQYSFDNNEQPKTVTRSPSSSPTFPPSQTPPSTPTLHPSPTLQPSPLSQLSPLSQQSITFPPFQTSQLSQTPPSTPTLQPSQPSQPSITSDMTTPPQSPNNTRKRSSPSSSPTTDLSYSQNSDNESSIPLSPCSPHPEILSPSSSKSPRFKRTYH